MYANLKIGVKSVVLAGLLAVLIGCSTSPLRAPRVPSVTAEEIERITPKSTPNLPLAEIVKLAKNGMDDEQIIEKIKLSNSHYDLTPSQSLELSEQGVHAKVLDYIHTDWEIILRNTFADEINKRQKQAEEQKEQEQLMLMREYQFRYNQFYDPYFGFGFSPYRGGYWPNRRPFGPRLRHRR
jgi:hypothetical protein